MLTLKKRGKLQTLKSKEYISIEIKATKNNIVKRFDRERETKKWNERDL